MDSDPSSFPIISRKRELFINLVVTAFSISLIILQGIILTPVYLKYISTELFGAWLATGNIIAWISLVDPGLARMMQQRTAATFGRRDFTELRAVLGTGLFIGALLSLLPLLAMPFSGVIAGSLKTTGAQKIELEYALKLGLIGTTFNIASYQPTAANLGLQNSIGSGSSQLLASLASILVSYFLLMEGFGLSAIPWGIIVRGALLLILNSIHLWIWCAKNLRASLVVSTAQMRAYFSLTAFVFIERLGITFVNQSEAYMVAQMVAPDAAAISALSGRAFDPVRTVGERLAGAFLPGMAHLIGEGNRERAMEVCRRILNVSAFVGTVGAACVLALNEGFVQVWVGSDLFGGQSLTLALAISLVMSVLFTSLAELVFAVGGVGQIEVMRAAEGVMRIGFQFLLLRRYGIIGIPIGACLGLLSVSAWFLPRLATRHLGGTLRARYASLLRYSLQAVVLLSCGMGLWYLTTLYIPHWTLTRFLCGAAIVGPLLTLVGLAINPPMRVEAQIPLRRVKAFFARKRK